jgi:uncharacterized protein (DUF1330 family)
VSIVPTPRKLEQLQAASAEQPVVILNLLRFKETAAGIDAGVSGLEAYARYGEAAAPFLARVGGRIQFAVQANQMVIGPEALERDMAILVEYPSVKKLLEMATDPEYLQIQGHRDAALADPRLIACGALLRGRGALGARAR